MVALDFYHKFVSGKTIRSDVSDLVAMETVFGWSVVGPCQSSSSDALHVGFVQSLPDVDHIESVIKRNTLLCDEQDEMECEQSTKGVEMVKLEDGRYEVKWPWRRMPSSMEANDKVAYRRFMVTAAKMSKKEDDFKAYDQYFRDFIEKAPRIARITRG